MKIEVLTPGGSILTDSSIKSKTAGHADSNDSQRHFDLSQEAQGMRIKNLGPESEFLSFALKENKLFCSFSDCASKHSLAQNSATSSDPAQ